MHTIKLRLLGRTFWKTIKVNAFKIVPVHKDGGLNHEIKPYLELEMPDGSLRIIPNIYEEWEMVLPWRTRQGLQTKPNPQQNQMQQAPAFNNPERRIPMNPQAAQG